MNSDMVTADLAQDITQMQMGSKTIVGPKPSSCLPVDRANRVTLLPERQLKARDPETEAN
ncbi:MAG: hypothetical protein AAF950_17425 [Pseudomonadota bacterium]